MATHLRILLRHDRTLYMALSFSKTESIYM